MTRLNKELSQLYKNTSLIQKFHLAIRYLFCPLSDVEKHVPREGKILDLGCGYGLLANLLALRAGGRNVVGLDKDAVRIKVAQATSSARKNIEFRVVDLLSYTPDSDLKCAVLVDLPLETNAEFLSKIYAALPEEGSLIIKSISRHPGWKYYLTLLHMATVDKILRGSLRNNFYFLNEDDFMILLKKIGFQVKFLDLSKGYPCTHCLYVCYKHN